MNKMTNVGLMTHNAQGASGAVALRGVKVDAEVKGASSLVRIQQRYVNTEDQAIDVSYLFPLEDQAALVDFKVYTQDKTLVGQVLEREAAFERYDDATTEGHGAYLLDQERPNAFTAQLGKLKPQQEAIIELSYVSSLSFEDERVRLMIPTVVAPRYVPISDEDPGEPEAERWQAPRYASVPYGLELSVRLHHEGGELNVSSPSHPISLSLSEGCVNVSLSREAEALDRDFVLTFDASSEARTGFAHLELEREGEGEEREVRYVGVTFKAPVISQSSEAQKRPITLIAVLDCSGSMSGKPIEQAKRALGLLWRTLKEGDHFNLTCFGSTYHSMWSSPRPYSQENLDEALAYLKRVDANLGGTEILAPLQKLLKRLKKEEGEAELVLLTDGQVSNEAEVISLCEKHKAHARVRSFGIGSGVSETLVRELARITLGSVEMIHTGERIEPKVLRASRHLRIPSLRLTSLSLAGHQLDLADPSPLIYPGELNTLYGKLSGPLDESAREVQVVLEGEEPLSLPFTSSEGGSPIVSALWARGAIRVLERSEARYSYHEGHDAWRASLVALATHHSMMSSQTSFVAVEEREEGEREEGEAPLHKVPLMMLSDHVRSSMWGMSAPMFSSLFGGGGGIAASFIQPRQTRKHHYLSLMSTDFSPPARPHLKRSMKGSPKFPTRKLSPRFDLDSLFDLLALQQASGAFVWGEALERALGEKASDLTQEERLDERLITSITLHLLKEKFKAQSDLWRSSAEKASALMEETQEGDEERLERAQGLLSQPSLDKS